MINNQGSEHESGGEFCAMSPFVCRSRGENSGPHKTNAFQVKKKQPLLDTSDVNTKVKPNGCNNYFRKAFFFLQHTMPESSSIAACGSPSASSMGQAAD